MVVQRQRARKKAERRDGHARPSGSQRGRSSSQPANSVVISLFNHKGGVSKTTTAFNLGWALADRGHTVLLVDADPQCNLTGMALELSGRDDFASFYRKHPKSNLYAALQPAFSGMPTQLAAPRVTATLNTSLHLLAGHIDLALYEPELSMAHKLVGAMPVLQNLPGAFGRLVRLTAKSISADYVLVDMSPSIGAINQNILMQSDYFIVPTSPDFFCAMAIDSLARILPAWEETAQALRASPAGLTYRLPDRPPQFIGMLSQRYRPRSKKPAQAFQSWIDEIVRRVESVLVPALAKVGMTIDLATFRKAVPDRDKFELAQIADFNSLIAHSQENATPIFALNEQQLQSVGIVLEQKETSRDEFLAAFQDLAETVERLCLPR